MKYRITNSRKFRNEIEAHDASGLKGTYKTLDDFLEKEHDKHAQIVQNDSYDTGLNEIPVKLPTPKEVANTFIAVLKAWLTSEEMELIREKMKNSNDPSVCYTHDYCDANMAMDQALELHGLKVDIQKDAHVDLMNNAWSLAYKNKFEFITS